ncbi:MULTISPECIES: hypothetical protein [unclassified Paraburkholderia]|uniref:hypothetical protein n=1 Tax=unclassified Paraburkholderia TaxID=2615204 RepID=UPI0034CED6E0
MFSIFRESRACPANGLGHQRPVRIKAHKGEQKFAVSLAQCAWQNMMNLRLDCLELGETDLVHRHPHKTRLVLHVQARR